MQYTTEITIPANTTQTNAIDTKLKLANGILHKVDIVFPGGCKSLVHVACFFGGHPVIPSTEPQSYSGDNESIIIPEFTKLYWGKNKITIRTWSLDDTFKHIVLLRFYFKVIAIKILYLSLILIK